MDRLTMDVRPGTVEVTICKVDGDGNGIIVLTGNMAGCSSLSEAEQEPRLQAIAQMVAAWNEKYAGGE